MAQRLPPFLVDTSLSLILFGGKGGVGKTTCAAATALQLAKSRPEESFLAVSIDPAHSLQDSFAGSPTPSNLELAELNAEADLEEFKRTHAGHLRQIAHRGTFFDDQDISQLLELSLPGLDEVMAFNSVADLVEASGHACIVVDSAPTGHVLRFLELPDAMQGWVETLDVMLAKHRYMARLFGGTYRKDEADAFLEDLGTRIERLRTMLQDADRCRFVPVITPDPLSIPETHKLISRLEQLGIPVGDILINRLHPRARDCPVCLAASAAQSRWVRRIIEDFSEDYSLWAIPLMGAQVQGAEQLSNFWNQGDEAGTLAGEDPASAKVPLRVDNPASLPREGQSLLLFGGKGGVGKTTLACATALRLAAEPSNGEVLILSTDPAHSLSACFDMTVEEEPTRVCSGLSAMELDAEAEFAELKEMYAEEVTQFFRSLAGEGKVDPQFDREVIERLLDLAPPGLDEVMALSRVAELVEQKKYEKFVLDTAPTGHLIRLLELPELVEQWLRVMFGLLLKYKRILSLPRVSEFLVTISKRIKKFRSLLRDADTTCLLTVSTLTDMALEETRDLVEACRGIEIHVPVLFLNEATPDGDCSICRAIAEGQSEVRGKFEDQFPEMEKPLVYKSGHLVGLEQLSDLGALLYKTTP